MSATTIKIQPQTKQRLDKLKLVAREPYDSVIQRAATALEELVGARRLLLGEEGE